MTLPSEHQMSLGRLMNVYMKSGLHIDVHWTSKGRLCPLGSCKAMCDIMRLSSVKSKI